MSFLPFLSFLLSFTQYTTPHPPSCVPSVTARRLRDLSLFPCFMCVCHRYIKDSFSLYDFILSFCVSFSHLPFPFFTLLLSHFVFSFLSISSLPFVNVPSFQPFLFILPFLLLSGGRERAHYRDAACHPTLPTCNKTSPRAFLPSFLLFLPAFPSFSFPKTLM